MNWQDKYAHLFPKLQNLYKFLGCHQSMMSSYRQYTHCTFSMCFIKASISWLALKIILRPVLNSPNCRVNYWSYLKKFSKNPWRIWILLRSERGIRRALYLWNVTIRPKFIYTHSPKLSQGKILELFNGHLAIHITFNLFKSLDCSEGTKHFISLANWCGTSQL